MKALAVLAALATPAHAGPCGDLVRLDNAINALLVHANNPQNKTDASYLDRCAADLLDVGKAMLPRFNIACAAILDADPAHQICVSASIQLGKFKIGRVQLFDSVRGWEHDPWKSARLPSGLNRVLEAYQRLGDARAAAVVRDVWTAANADAASKESSLAGWQRKQVMATWRAWRVQAAAALGVLGDASAIEFLDAQARTTDAAVARACRDAVRAIERRKK